MDCEQAELYVAAAQGNPFLAAWVSVLDAFGMPPITEVAPADWEDAFEALFHLGLVTDEQFNSVDFKKSFRRKPPPARDVESALAALSSLRRSNQLEESPMTKDIFEKPTALTLKSSPRSELASGHGGFEPLAPRSDFPAELTAARARAPSPLAPLEPTRRAIESAPPARMASLEPAPGGVDPRTYVEDFCLELKCCGQPLELIYDDGRDVTDEEQAPQYMVEFLLHAVCPHCRGQVALNNIRPMPADFILR